jgi:YspA, cpYpsA-related SLOG family
MKVIIAGSRTITNYEIVRKAIENSGFKITEVVSGTANGPDKFGERWAYINKVPIQQFPAQWKKTINDKTFIDKSAGFRRNREMANYAEALIAIWDGYSKGTFHMIDTMQRLNKPVYIMETKC